MATTSRVCVLSVGDAQPYAAKVIASGFGIDPEEAVARIYRAPSVLVDDVEPSMADKLVALLDNIGLQVESQPLTESPPPPALLYDVSVFLNDERHAFDAADTIAEFIGADRDAVLDMLRQPPGLILGAVSDATVDALERRLGDLADVTRSRPEDATFSLLLATDDNFLKSRVIDDLKHAGIELLAADGLIARELTHEQMREVWQRHGPSGSVIAVNEAFLRFDIVLDEVLPEATHVTETLGRLAGIPAELAPRVVDSIPITLNGAIAHADVVGLLEDYTAAGLVTHARMITFQRDVLQVTKCPDPRMLVDLLAHMGLEAPPRQSLDMPFVIPATLGELDARLWKTALEDAGMGVEYCEEEN